MDFDLSETQQEIARLTADVLSAADPWKELARSGLLALAVPTELGGDGLGVLEVAVLLTEVGRRAVPVPALATLMTGVLPIARWADASLKRELLPAAAAGELILTAAHRDAMHTSTTLVENGRPVSLVAGGSGSAALVGSGSATVSGTKVGVPYAAEAGRILVAAGDRVVLVDPAAPGVTITRTPTSAGDPEYTVRLDDAPVVATLQGTCARDLRRLANAGACCLADGALAGALALTRDHVATRRQFGRPLAEFQAVSQQIADVYIASRTLHLATLSACWRLHTGRDPDSDLDVAAWWLRGEALNAVLLCHHLHGGIGVDISYPLPRISSLFRDLSRYLGDAGVH
jgi:alkylation response protein AidB-like acyl-CoA dehydrogenase